ncbi:hypothetical protein [Burkholderia pyrrocinia]|uniref:hypothetical protein n=1 Tax=Burkholderia pyrrocinia TaxID=60550 RepID=UPI002AB1B47F|nr:hypothetical protein [Burkholderia pyrrocinia]
MATNDFLVFGGGSSPNVIDQATYAALAARLSGFVSGTAQSQQLNKVWRQSSIMAAVLAQFTANFSGQNSVDDGTTATLLANLQAAINAAGITAPQFDNSVKQATTAFVQRALGNFQAFGAYTASQVLTASQSGSLINFWGGSASTFTLPSAAAMPTGGTFTFNNTSAVATVTITRAGSDTILAGGGGTSIVLNPGDNLIIAQAGGTQWVATGGSAQLPFAGVMASASWTTAPRFDSSAKLATTAFVQRAVGNFSGVQLVQGANVTLDASAFGCAIQLAGAASTVTLPSGTGVSPGSVIRFYAQGSANYTITAPSGGFIYAPGAGLGSSNPSITLGPNDTVDLMNRGSGEWDVIGGSWIVSNEAITLGARITGTTPAAGDNSTKLATTAWYQNQIAAGIGVFLGVQVFTASGTYTPGTYTVSGQTVTAKKARVRACGAGGAGGSITFTTSSQIAIAAGGNSGAIGEVVIMSGLASQTVTIGAGGAPGAQGNNPGGSGGTTSFGTLLVCPGGQGGYGGAGFAPPGAVFANGLINTCTSASPATAVVLGSTSIGGTGQGPALSVALGGIGANCAEFGSGGNGGGGGVGNPAVGRGAGGGGAGQGASSASGATGGAGGPGYLIVEEYA